jgi:hypothetical protein
MDGCEMIVEALRVEAKKPNVFFVAVVVCFPEESVDFKLLFASDLNPLETLKRYVETGGVPLGFVNGIHQGVLDQKDKAAAVFSHIAFPVWKNAPEVKEILTHISTMIVNGLLTIPGADPMTPRAN